MLRDQIGVFVLLLLACLTPDRPPPKDAPVPDPPFVFDRKTRFGDMSSRGDDVKIIGDVWSAKGRWKDGWLELAWTSRNGTRCIGAYAYDSDGKLQGMYAHQQQFEVDGIFTTEECLEPCEE